ncbi:hypothetical protein SOCE26_056160 [Sorangium cellulosum]|uniref:Uncharacterized protein n=1 Tax=Sorangium cellulosum TaxID=56 RepID=A0A2L0EXY6_SORCE|nr:hypothetical protein [Sorangium cellulosum]AUX44153.1 hypothetical protein SOCE26_056160 [Sorangium cellulosum]
MTANPLRMAARTPGGSSPGARFPSVGGRRALPALRRLAAAAAGALALSFAGAARADEAQQFELAKTRFDAGHYEEAVSRFAAMLDPANAPCERGATDAEGGKPCRITDPDLIERARGLAAAALVALRRSAEADAYIEKILLDNPSYAPNLAVFPPEVIDRFTAARARIRARIEEVTRQRAEAQREARLRMAQRREEERRWIAEIQRLAGSERVVERNSRWIGMLPFGVGQFQNGDEGLGWFFLVSQAVAGGTSIVSALALSSYENVDVTPGGAAAVGGAAGQTVDIDALNSRIKTAAAVNRVAFGAFATLVAAGIAHAQITFVPERVSFRARPVPPPPPSFTAAPTISLLPGGLSAGLLGRF